MNAKECAETLRSFIRHRERMCEKETIFVDSDGMEIGRGYLNPEKDVLLQTMKFVLPLVEEQISKLDTAQG